MLKLLPARWLAVLPALTAFAGGAQTRPAPDAAVATDAAPPLAYHSAMEGYQRFAEEKPVLWKEANETVRQRGGWQAYAKESAGAAEDKPSGATDPHAGHAMPKPAAPSKEKR